MAYSQWHFSGSCTSNKRWQVSTYRGLGESRGQMKMLDKDLQESNFQGSPTWNAWIFTKLSGTTYSLLKPTSPYEHSTHRKRREWCGGGKAVSWKEGVITRNKQWRKNHNGQKRRNSGQSNDSGKQKKSAENNTVPHTMPHPTTKKNISNKKTHQSKKTHRRDSPYH